MKVVTWNINSVRLRAHLVVEMMRAWQPDVICLQETKTVNETFPSEIFEAEGYSYQHIWGMKSYNGQAILSKIPFHSPRTFDRCGFSDCRHGHTETKITKNPTAAAASTIFGLRQI